MNIKKNVKVQELPLEYEVALQTMEQYLVSHHKRRTVERQYILQAIYQSAQPVDVATLHDTVCQQNGNVSLATVYYTVNLLVELKLARRIDPFGNGTAYIEKTLGTEPHGFVVCNKCGSISNLYSPEFLQSLQSQLPCGFAPDEYTLYVHGLCAKCKKGRKTRKKKQQ